MSKLYVLGNHVDWCEISLQRLIAHRNVVFFNGLFPINGATCSKLCKLTFSRKLNSYIPVPLKRFWFSLMAKNLGIDSDERNEVWVLVYDHNILGENSKWISFLKDKYPNIKAAYIFTNIAKLSRASELGYLEQLNSWYDVVFAFDPEDAKKYGFSYSPLIYDADPNYKKEEKESKENLVFYVGQAKDRLPGLLSCFEKLKQLGIKTDFHIANVKEEDIKYSDEIIYNKFMTYTECVDSIQKATCLIDVIQCESTGLTIKTCEAVCYDKKLITTNKHVVEYPFYDSRYIRVVESPDDIDESFFNENRDVHYSKEGKAYFSAESFLKRVEDELKER